MFIKQGDLFWEMSKEFVKEAMTTSTKQSRNEGDILFKLGDTATHFFVLVKGRVLLMLGEAGPQVYMARHAGEIIGWSTIIGRETYSATARCEEACNLICFERDTFIGILGKDPANERMLYKRLAEMLGQRLIDVYPSVA